MHLKQKGSTLSISLNGIPSKNNSQWYVPGMSRVEAKQLNSTQPLCAVTYFSLDDWRITGLNRSCEAR